MIRSSRSRARLALTAIALGSMLGSGAHAATRSMTGAIFVKAPSADIEGGIGVFGRKVGGVGPVTYAPTDGAKTLSVAGTTTGTFVGRPITLAAGRLGISGADFQDFPPFSNVGQLTRSFMSDIDQATFANNGGALAACPGPGCTASGAGTAISWCPPLTHDSAAPAPGTVGAQVGNWDCPSWAAGGVGGSFMRGVARPNLGNNCGTNTVPAAPVQGSGFRMTTGTISGSDPYPYGLVITTVGGTPFNPNFGSQPLSQGFFFSRMGTDAVSGTNRNLVLLGGGVTVDPSSGNAFFRIMDLQMNLMVPEPTTGLGLPFGSGALVSLARGRRD